MAKLKTAKNMIQNRDEYARFFSNFRGVDFSSDHIEVADQRFAYLVNMWRDYKSGEGGAVETIPGFRRVYEVTDGFLYNDNLIHGFHLYGRYRLVHAGDRLINIDVEAEVEVAITSSGKLDLNTPDIDLAFIKDVYINDKKVEHWERLTLDEGEYITITEYTPTQGDKAVIKQGVISPKMAQKKSTSVFFNNRLYIFDGENIFWWEGGKKIYSIVDFAYVPTTHELIYPGSKEPLKAPGIEMEQRNILTPKYKNKFIAGTDMDDEDKNLAKWKGNVFQLKYGSDYEEKCGVAGKVFPEHTEVYQYGEKLPFANVYKNNAGEDAYSVPEGHPNAVVSITKDGLVTLVVAPPKPEAMGFAETYDGIEIIAENAITNINGIEAKGGPETIITHCTIATVFDNRLFLSGNPEFPTHIFWSGLNGETSYPDPTYFGIVNNDIEGVTNSPVTAMLPVADQLMVLKRENASEGSVIFHTPTIGSDNVMPKIYPSTQGLPGRGCLGAACNFLDDPVFVSRLGLEAMGSYTNAKYERSIEHRSSLIDSKLLTCNLSGAELIEYEGYLLLLCDGKIFMADSRQTFAHQSGVMQYEWYYLEDIGVWEGQKPEFVYAMFPTKLSGFAPVREATGVCDELGVVHNLIGQPVDESRGKIVEDMIFGYLQYLDKNYDVNGNESILNPPIYVEKSGAMTGGTFIPAERLYVIGEDLYFSAGKYLCKFYFDKRDKSTGIIPVEYYNFDGRRIFSGCATKMDNCGIPHLTKNTVKRSTVIKTRTFTHSNAKIKCRTNKKAFAQVGRIINGHEVFEGMDFADFTFNVDGKTLFSVNEKEKKWVEKQYFIYSDEYCEPFAIHYLAYRYNVAGRYKEK